MDGMRVHDPPCYRAEAHKRPTGAPSAAWRSPRGGYRVLTPREKLGKGLFEKMRKNEKNAENAKKDGEIGELESFQNPQPKTGKSPTSGRTRLISVMTYASEKQIRNVMRDHLQQIRAFAYIYHDKDTSEPHHHVVIRTYDSWTPTQIIKWFGKLVDKNKEHVNTLAENVRDANAIIEYLTHSDTKSQEEGKHVYPNDAIKDYGINDIVEKKISVDDSMEIIDNIMLGMSVRELVRRYGRKYVYHYGAYHDIAANIRLDEGCREARMNSTMQRAVMLEVNELPFNSTEGENYES